MGAGHDIRIEGPRPDMYPPMTMLTADSLYRLLADVQSGYADSSRYYRLSVVFKDAPPNDSADDTDAYAIVTLFRRDTIAQTSDSTAGPLDTCLCNLYTPLLRFEISKDEFRTTRAFDGAYKEFSR